MIATPPTIPIQAHYDYAVTNVTKVVDGDTVDLTLDLGFRLTMNTRFRILNLNTPERGMPYWLEANLFTGNWLLIHSLNLRAATFKADDFGRWLAGIYDGASGEVLADDCKAYLAQYGIDANYYPKK